MIVKRYGTTYQSVELNFDSKALSEVGFRRDRQRSWSAEEFEDAYERVSVHELTAEAEGRVQDHTEQALLDDLEGQVRGLLDELGEDEVLVFENGDSDYPKTRQKTRNVVEDGENLLHFTYTVAPAVRFGVYRAR